ncbi:MAG TPA: carboxypeptidase regulatory-like domain-containing protein [Myxococcaceae bacterium]
MDQLPDEGEDLRPSEAEEQGLAEPELAHDGELVIHVTGQERPVAGAQVQVADGMLIEGEATTGPDGIARVRGRHGAREVLVRAKGFATTVAQAQRPEGQASLAVQVALLPAQTLRGVVLDRRTRKPVPGAHFKYYDHGMLDGYREASSDAQGAFVLPDLHEGPYTLWLEHTGYAPQAVLATLPSPPVEVLLAPLARLSGQVLNPQGQPDAGVEVKATFYGPHTATGVTGADGRFSLEVRNGTYHLSARSGGLAGASPAGIKVEPGDHIQEVVIRLTTSGALKGQVVARTTGKGVAQASISVQDDATRTSSRVGADEHGRFALESLPAGKYNLDAYASGYATQRLGSVLIEPGSTREVKLELVRTGTIEGVVRDTTGAPVPQLSVLTRLESGKPALAHDESGTALEATGHTTDAQGRYRLEKVAGPIRLRVYRSLTPLTEEKLVQVPEDRTVTVDFVVPAPGPMGTVVGTVRRPDGSPPGAMKVYVSASPGLQDHRVRSPGPDGRYELRLPVGTHKLQAQDEGNAWGPAQTVTVEEGKTVTVDLSLRAFVTTTGQVFNPDGRPAVGVFVLASLDDALTNNTDAQGQFVLKSSPEVAGQETDAWFSSRDGRTATKRLKVGSQDVRVQLQPSATLKGRVVGSGAKVEGFRLVIDEAAKPPYFSFSSIQREFPQDHFVVNDLPAFMVTVMVRTQDGRAGKAQVALEPGKQTTVEVPLGNVGWIRGRLVPDGRGGQVHLNKWVYVDLRQKNERRTASDQSGRFEILGLEPGSHVFSVTVGENERVERRFDIRAGQFLDLGDIPIPGYK